jgi:hypothetical protein
MASSTSDSNSLRASSSALPNSKSFDPNAIVEPRRPSTSSRLVEHEHNLADVTAFIPILDPDYFWHFRAVLRTLFALAGTGYLESCWSAILMPYFDALTWRIRADESGSVPLL